MSFCFAGGDRASLFRIGSIGAVRQWRRGRGAVMGDLNAQARGTRNEVRGCGTQYTVLNLVYASEIEARERERMMAPIVEFHHAPCT